MISDLKLLQFDTELFGYKVAITHSADNLNEKINYARENYIKLLYILLNNNDMECNKDIFKSGGFLVDEKVTYLQDINDIKVNYLYNENIVSLKDEDFNDDILDLVLQSGVYSRFKTDKNFTKNEFENLYELWIKKSLSREIANEVLAYKTEDTIAGFVTIGEKNKRGDIGLIAVDSKYRGKQIGKQLMNSAFEFLKLRGLESVQVVTQKQNEVACKFYSKIGFNLEKTEYYYHLWIE